MNELFEKKQKLANGAEIPVLGLGTWLMEPEEAEKASADAVRIGYRHIDTAQAYENEDGVGKAVRSCGVARDELFVTSKVKAELKSYKAAKESIDESLSRSGLDFLDLMLIHCPQPWSEFRGEKRYFEENKEVWRALEEAYKEGKCRAIGVSNFLIDDLESLLSDCTIKPMVNQYLCHIGKSPLGLLNYCKEKGIVSEAYSPVAHGEILKNESALKMAEKYGVSVPQLCLRFDLQLGMVILPKTTNPRHMEDNSRLGFEISDEDMEILKNAEKFDSYGKSGVFPVFSK